MRCHSAQRGLIRSASGAREPSTRWLSVRGSDQAPRGSLAPGLTFFRVSTSERGRWSHAFVAVQWRLIAIFGSLSVRCILHFGRTPLGYNDENDPPSSATIDDVNTSNLLIT